MRVVQANNTEMINIGRQLENLATEVVFDLSNWIAEFGDGAAALIVRRVGDSNTYPVSLERQDSKAIWKVTSADTELAQKNRYGRCELRWYVGDVLAKSNIWKLYVEPSMTGQSGATPPTPEQSWVDKVLEAGVAAENAATNAKDSASEAVASETAAKASETAAAESASAAQQSATSAAESAAVYDTVIADVDQLKNDLDKKIDKPSTAPAVGKILKVLSVNDDGTFVCEWGDAPVGGVTDVMVNETSVVSDGVGLIKLFYNSLGINQSGIFIRNPSSANINTRESNTAVSCSMIDYAVKAAMCDGKGEAWTYAEKTSAWKRLTSIKTAMDDVAVAGSQYYLGEQTAVSVVLPDDAEVGQMVTVSWYNGATAATLSITGTMLAFDYAPSANTRSEINALWDGTYWAVLGNEMEVPSGA